MIDGGFIAIWRRVGLEFGVFGKIYTEDGNVRVEEFRMNSYTSNSTLTYFPSVGVLTDGDIVCVWQNGGRDNSSEAIVGQVSSD